MRVVGFSGYSGAGKTTLLEQLIGRLVSAGQRVSIVKHAHHAFDIDVEGKDSWRHRRAGAFEVLVASDRRLALMREYERPADPSVHSLVAELSDAADGRQQWVLVEGFRHADIPKIEVWRADTGKAVQYPADPFIVAIATDSPAQLPVPTALPLLALNDPDAVAVFLLTNPARYEYRPPFLDSRCAGVAADAAPAPVLDDAGRHAGAADRGSPPVSRG